MYPQLKQSGYDRDVAPEWDQVPQWQQAQAHGQAQSHQYSGYRDGWSVEPGYHDSFPAAYADPRQSMPQQPEVMWPPPSQHGAYGHQHYEPLVNAAPAKGRPWRRALLALAFTFAGGVYARPLLEHHARELPGDARVVGYHVLGMLPAWLPTTLTPSVAPAATKTQAFAGIVTTPLPSPRAAVAPKPAAAPVAAAPAAIAPAPPAIEVAEAAPAPEVEPEVAPVLQRQATVERRRHGGRDKKHSHRKVAVALPVAAKTPPAPSARPEAKPEAAAPPAVVATAAPRVAAARKAPADSLDSLMARAMVEADPSEAKPAATAALSDEKRSTLSRNQIVDVMKALTADVNACGTDLVRPTNADLTLTVGAGGDVSGVKVTGPLFATMTAGCIVRAVKTASFPVSKGMSFSYRYTLRPTARAASTAMAAPIKPERITGSAPTAGAQTAPSAASLDKSVLPKLPSKVKLSDDPLSGLNGRTFEGQAERRGRSRK